MIFSTCTPSKKCSVFGLPCFFSSFIRRHKLLTAPAPEPPSCLTRSFPILRLNLLLNRGGQIALCNTHYGPFMTSSCAFREQEDDPLIDNPPSGTYRPARWAMSGSEIPQWTIPLLRLLPPVLMIYWSASHSRWPRVWICQQVLTTITQGLVEELDGAFARIWLLGPGDLCADCYKAADCTNRDRACTLRRARALYQSRRGISPHSPGGAQDRKIAKGDGSIYTNDVSVMPATQQAMDDGQGLRSFAGYP